MTLSFLVAAWKVELIPLFVGAVAITIARPMSAEFLRIATFPAYLGAYHPRQQMRHVGC